MTAERATKQVVILGYNGTGKTTLVRKIVKAALKNNQKVLIVTPDDVEWLDIPMVHPRLLHHIKDYVGARKMIYEEDVTLPAIIDHFNDGMLIFDDCRAYLTASTTSELHRLMIRRRQKMIDIIAVGHGFTEVPPKFFTFSSEIILFQTKDEIKRRKNVMKNYDEMAQHQMEINKKAESNPHYYRIIKQ